jgi:uncharacterized membrane protein
MAGGIAEWLALAAAALAALRGGLSMAFVAGAVVLILLRNVT